jgi:hypothetical protein
MSPEVKKYLEDIRVAAVLIQDFTRDKTFADYNASDRHARPLSGSSRSSVRPSTGFDWSTLKSRGASVITAA